MRAFGSVAMVLGLCAAYAGAGVPDNDPRVTPVVLAYRKARPAVVNISTEQLVDVRMGLFDGGTDDDMFPSPIRRRIPVQSLGSGVLVHPSGYVVTNAHVVQRAEKIMATLADKTRLEARVISADPGRDLAVIKLDVPKGKWLPFLYLARSDDLLVGETVIVVGNALGLADSVTVGVVSATDRTLDFNQGQKMAGLIQTDAPINPGNSGGPLLNIKGEFIGINTAIRADAQNIGFAIPADTIAAELTRLLDTERLNRVVFGASVETQHGPRGDDVVVGTVRPGTPALGRLEVGDRLTSINGRAIAGVADFLCAMVEQTGESTIRLGVRRGGRDAVVDVPLKAKPRPDGRLLARQKMGLTLKPLDRELAQELGISVAQGLLVVGVDEDGPGGRVGVRPRDVLFQVDRYYVKDLESLGLILEETSGAEPIKIGIIRGRVRAWAPLKLRE